MATSESFSVGGTMAAEKIYDSIAIFCEFPQFQKFFQFSRKNSSNGNESFSVAVSVGGTMAAKKKRDSIAMFFEQSIC